MSTYEATTTIERPADEVWTYAADIVRHTEWMSVTDARILAGDPTQPGARGRERLTMGPFRWDIDFDVVTADPGRRLTWRSTDDPRINLEVDLRLEPAGPTGRATTATYRGDARLRGRWRLLAPLLAMEGSAGIRRELDRLKTQVEQDSSAAPATTG